MPAAEDSDSKVSRGRQPTKEERALWRQIVRDATPLHPERYRGPEAPDTRMSEQSQAAEKPAESPKCGKPKPGATPAKAAAESKPRPKTLDEGHMADMDRRTADRFRRGRLPIEARLDLHGMTRAAAHDSLDRFIAHSAARGLRCVLVITGKGTFSNEGGVLRREMPRWLNLAGTREKILAFTSAQRHHGGGGAFYLLLRRRRE